MLRAALLLMGKAPGCLIPMETMVLSAATRKGRPRRQSWLLQCVPRHQQQL